jgi:thioredoxin reductase
MWRRPALPAGQTTGEFIMTKDAIVVGGSFAGVAAALQLARARRKVLLIDAGAPRNRFAKAAHGMVGHDDKTPKAILAEAWRQLRAYGEVEIFEGEAVKAEKEGGEFRVELADGREGRARRLVLATGVRDELPPLPGLEGRWGVTVLHCPYCHGYEFGGKRLGVLANHGLAVHQALLIPDWGPTTLFTQGIVEPDAEERAKLKSRGVTIETSKVVELLGDSPQLEAVRLEDGRVVPLDAFFTQSKTHQASPLAEMLGCKFDEGPLGSCILLEDNKQTTVEGVYAAGDAASSMHSASLAAASGVLAGIGAHQSLIAQL